jgi:MFS family permease
VWGRHLTGNVHRRRPLYWLTSHGYVLAIARLRPSSDPMHTVGVGLCLATNSAPLLVTELAYPTQRAPITALYNSSWYIGSIISAWTTYATLKIFTDSDWAWR